MTYNEHLGDARMKAQELANKLFQTRRVYRAKEAFIRTVVESMVKPARSGTVHQRNMGHKAGIAHYKKILMVAQRPFLRAAVRSYSTTSTCALQVLNGTPP